MKPFFAKLKGKQIVRWAVVKELLLFKKTNGHKGYQNGGCVSISYEDLLFFFDETKDYFIFYICSKKILCFFAKTSFKDWFDVYQTY